jgi:hypothetical protein
MDHIVSLDRVGAEANLARTTLFSAFVGDELSGDNPADQAVNVGANLAEFTGGSYNRSNSTLAGLTNSIVEHCSCIYRIALVKPRSDGNRVHRVRVEAAGRVVPFRYRLEFLSEVDRWWRQARGVLENPALGNEVAINAMLLPIRRDKTGWTVTARIGVDVDSLMLIPEATGQRGSWEVGALLYRESGGPKWEMLGVSRVHIDGAETTGSDVVHERTFEGIPPGSYRLGAFVRDGTTSLFGGGEATIDLPRPGQPAVPAVSGASTPETPGGRSRHGIPARPRP